MELTQITPYGRDFFDDLPCIYGHKQVPTCARLTRTAICFVNLGPGAETKNSPEEVCHFHRRLTEFYVFLAGSGEMLFNRTKRPVRSGNVALIPPNVCHTVAAGPEGLEFLVVTLPPYDPNDSFDVFDASEIRGEFSESWLRRWSSSVNEREPIVEDVFAEAEYGLYRASLPAGWSIPKHQHSLSEEFYLVLDGSAEVEVGEVRDEMSNGTIVVLPCNSPHKVTAGANGVEYLIFATPPITDVQTPCQNP